MADAERACDRPGCDDPAEWTIILTDNNTQMLGLRSACLEHAARLAPSNWHPEAVKAGSFHTIIPAEDMAATVQRIEVLIQEAETTASPPNEGDAGAPS